MDQLITRESLAVLFPHLIFLTATSYRELITRRITNKWLLFGLVYFLAARLIVGPNSVTDYLCGGGILFSMMWLLWMLGILGGGAAKLSAVVGIALGMRFAALVAAFQTLAFLMIFSVIWLLKKRQSQQHEERTQFIDTDHECGQGSEVASTRSLASSPFSLAIVTGILVQQWLRF